MATSAPIMPFLRPSALPRPATFRHFLRFSTTTRPCQASQSSPSTASQKQGQEQSPSTSLLTADNFRPTDPNLLASLKASPTYPPPSMNSLPRPKESRASHRANHPRTTRTYPTRHPTHTTIPSPRLTPEPITSTLEPTHCAPNLSYFVTRTANNELPIYTLRKRGGNLLFTRVKKVDGRREDLCEALRAQLGLKRDEVGVNPVTGHVVVRGHWRGEVERFLRERLF
ncbi:hypothetical protein KC330_g2350 [Hortaea werneckii]|nr:hypothetical protein KC330_g2350 [Hortaea werneckii]